MKIAIKREQNPNLFGVLSNVSNLREEKIAIKREQNPNLFGVLSNVSNLREAKIKVWDDYIREKIFPGATKIVLKMKLTFIMILLSFLGTVASETYSQTTRLSLELKNETVENVLGAIEEKSDFYFLYSAEMIDVNRKVSINILNSPVENILDLLFKGTGITYTVKNRQIVLSPGKDLVAQQQPHSVSGRVTDSAGTPLPGVAVAIKNTTQGTITDANGNYSLTNVSGDATLVFSFMGMKTQEIAVAGKINMNVTMHEETVGIEEVVAIGYGIQKKASLTAAISNMNGEDIAKIPTSNLSNVLAGRLSGTFVRSSTGTPGISSDIRIRGQSSWNPGSPIYVIDGVVRDKTSFDALDPNEVDRITILKDAASAAIYGSRSSNGVVLVNTKTGKAGKIIVDYNSAFGTQRTGKLPHYMDMKDALYLSRTFRPNVSDEEINYALKNNPKGRMYYDAAYQDPTSQKHSVSVSGGSESVNYYIGGSFFDESGFLPNVWYKKYNLRANVQAKITKDLSVRLNISNNYGTRNRYNWTYDYGADDLAGAWGMLLYYDSFYPPYIDGKPVDSGWIMNPVEQLKSGGCWRNKNQQIDALLNVEYQVPFVKGLSVGASYSKNMDNSFIKNFAKKYLLYTFKFTGDYGLIPTNEVLSSKMSGEPSREYIGNEYAKTDAYQLNAQINYDRHFGGHHISATAVYEQYEMQYNYFSMYRYNFLLFTTDQFFAASKNPGDWSTDGNEAQDGRLSYIGRLNYEYADKYLFSASARYDGSIKFAPGKRWGLFPSVSAGWVISNENFYRQTNALSFIDMMKIRLSFGSTGSDAIGGWGWIDQYNVQSSSYYMGSPGTLAPTLGYGGIPNADLTWEKSNTYNLGLDLHLVNHISFTVDFWERHTYDILGSRILALPSEFGGSLPATNYGIVDSKGLELELGYHHKIGNNLSYHVKANVGLATTKVVKRDFASNSIPVDDPNGKTLSYGTGYRALGIFRTQADLDNVPSGYTIFGATPELGMMNFADINGPNGIPDNKIDDYDRIVLGNYMGSASAPVSYGLAIDLAYKNFNVNMLFAGLAGFKLTYNDPWSRNFNYGGLISIYHADHWSVDNPNGNASKIYSRGDPRTAGYTQPSTFNTYDATFIRMKDLNIGYTFKSDLIKKAGISKAQLYVSGTNLFYFSKFKFYDPEINQFMSYPIMKSYSLGLNLQF